MLLIVVWAVTGTATTTGDGWIGPLTLLFAAVAALAALLTVWQARQAHIEQEKDRARARQEREQDRQERNADRREVEIERQRQRREEADDRRETDRRHWRQELIEIGQLVEDLGEASRRMAGLALSPDQKIGSGLGRQLHQLRRALRGHEEKLPACVGMTKVENGMYHGPGLDSARGEIDEKLHELAD